MITEGEFEENPRAVYLEIKMWANIKQKHGMKLKI